MTPTRALPIVGHSLWFHADTSGFLTRLARERGDIAEFRLGRGAAFLLSHPVHVERVLVRDAGEFHKGGLIRRARRLLGDGLITSEGDLHHAQRRRVRPALATRRVAEYAVAVPSLADRVASRWNDGQQVDIGAAMGELALSAAVEEPGFSVASGERKVASIWRRGRCATR